MIADQKPEMQCGINVQLFENGAFWMQRQMRNWLGTSAITSDLSAAFTVAGIIKYGLSLSAFSVSLFFLFPKSFLFLPAAILIFYIVEVHFLFLFPLMIDRVEKPFYSSVKATYKVGFFRCLFSTIVIAAYMIVGFFRFKDPLRNWYVGCMAILIWYKNEIRNRL